MSSVASIRSDTGETVLPRDRAGLVRHLAMLAEDLAAERYMLLDLAPENGEACIVACNWVFDTVRAVGIDLMRRVAEGPCTTFLGQQPRLWSPSLEAATRGFPTPGEAGRLEAGGHGEIASTRIRTGRLCHVVVFSAARPGTIEAAGLPAAHLALSYALSAAAAATAATAAPSPVSERELECLRWVSEGKTAEEIATIVGVTANTVNSYVNHAIRKLSARNRAMAIATAIRAGVI